MENNEAKKTIIDKMNENLEEMNYVFSDITKATIKLIAKLKNNDDEKSLLWLQKFENKLLEVKQKTEVLSLAYKPQFAKYVITMINCLEIETKRVNYMKNLLVKAQKYEYTAQLRGIEKGIEELKDFINFKEE